LIAVIKVGETVFSYPGLIALGEVGYVPSTDEVKEMRNTYGLAIAIGYSDTSSGRSERRWYDVRFDGGGVIVSHRLRPRQLE
jgi:hypothetical protein